MTVWKEHSPFEWVGYYLGGPCHGDHSWRGKRQFLEHLGFNILPVYVGYQGGAGCGHEKLSAEAGGVHGTEAANAMVNDGFPKLRYVYLDVEPVDILTAVQKAYVKAWITAVLQHGHYLPALYLHKKNATALRTILRSVLTAHDHQDPARLWVCGGPATFSLDDVPKKSTVADAFAWQGSLDHNVTYGGVTLHVDRSVALTPYPGA